MGLQRLLFFQWTDGAMHEQGSVKDVSGVPAEPAQDWVQTRVPFLFEPSSQPSDFRWCLSLLEGSGHLPWLLPQVFQGKQPFGPGQRFKILREVFPQRHQRGGFSGFQRTHPAMPRPCNENYNCWWQKGFQQILDIRAILIFICTGSEEILLSA